MKFVLLLLFFALSNISLAQSPTNFMMREIAPCARLMGNGTSPPNADYEQPCQNSPINEVTVKRFADNSYGVKLSYSDYERAWVRLLECEFVGQGKLSSGSVNVSKILVNNKWQACEISVSQMPRVNQRLAKIEFSISPACASLRVCSHTELSAGSISGRVEKPFSPAFNCSKASTDTEKAICMDWNLAELDFTLSSLWASDNMDSQSSENKSQSMWLKTRDSCQADGKCIEKSYKDRLAAVCASKGDKIDKDFNCRRK
jgi:hypothetical protein